MRLRRRIFKPKVHTTDERGRPITLTLCPGWEFDLSVGEAQLLSDDLNTALDNIEGTPQ